MVKFEYEWLRHKGAMEDLLAELNALGDQGWEVIYIYTAEYVDVLLKRFVE